MDIPFNTFVTKSLINTMGKPLEKSANFSILVGPEKNIALQTMFTCDCKHCMR